MLVSRKSFSEVVYSLMFGGNVRKSNHILVKRFTYGMTINFDMFHTLMKYKISGDMNSTSINYQHEDEWNDPEKNQVHPITYEAK